MPLRYARAMVAVSRWLDPWMRNRLFRKYVVPFVAVVAGGADVSGEPRFRETRGGRVWYGPVYFRKESEPYMTLAVPHGTSVTAPVTAAEVNLKFIWDVVSQIRVGRLGQAYVVDRQGHLLAHTDISLVLRKTAFSTQTHVRAARAGATEPMLATD